MAKPFNLDVDAITPFAIAPSSLDVLGCTSGFGTITFNYQFFQLSNFPTSHILELCSATSPRDSHEPRTFAVSGSKVGNTLDDRKFVKGSTGVRL